MEIPGYRNLTVLGGGGFSTVYRAVQESVHREVALKVLGVHMAGDDARARFSRECATNGRVGTHPNIVTLFDSGFADDGSPYLAMQLCSGGSLSERLRATGALPVSQVLRIGVKIAAALQYAHSAGVLHRDIKPENILISDFGEPELADFGISSVDDQRLSTVTASSFTINHAAPEALAGQPSSVSTDVYSLCSTLYTLVAGHAPFTAPSSTAVVALVNLVMNQPAPATGRADVPDSLERLLAAGLAKIPSSRPTDARAVGSALQRIQGELGLPVTEFPSAPPPLAGSRSQASSGLGAGARGGAALGGAALGGALDTGSMPATGAMPPPSPASTSMNPVGPAAAPGPWGAWASEVGTGQRRSPVPGDGGRSPAVPPVIFPPSGPGLATGPDRGPDRRAWWIAAIALTVLFIGAGIYLLAVHKSSPASPNPTATNNHSAVAPAPASPASPARSPAASTTKKLPPPSTTSSAPTATSPSATSRSTISSSSAAAAAAVIASFGSSTTPAGEVDCATPTSVVNIPMTWQTDGATKAWIGIDTSDAATSPYASVATSSTDYGLRYACSVDRHVFTLTVANADGRTTSASVTYTSKFPATTSSTPTTPTVPATPTQTPTPTTSSSRPPTTSPTTSSTPTT